MTSVCRVRQRGGPGVNGVGVANGGLGALVSGGVFLTSGTTLDIVVGQQGGSGVFPAPVAAEAAAASCTSWRVTATGRGGRRRRQLFHGANGGPGQNGTSGQAGFDPATTALAVLAALTVPG